MLDGQTIDPHQTYNDSMDQLFFLWCRWIINYLIDVLMWIDVMLSYFRKKFGPIRHVSNHTVQQISICLYLTTLRSWNPQLYLQKSSSNLTMNLHPASGFSADIHSFKSSLNKLWQSDILKFWLFYFGLAYVFGLASWPQFLHENHLQSYLYRK